MMKYTSEIEKYLRNNLDYADTEEKVHLHKWINELMALQPKKLTKKQILYMRRCNRAKKDNE